MSATTERNTAISLARSNPQAAHLRAKGIADPWFRCQALAWTGWLTSDPAAARKVLDEAVQAVWDANDPTQCIGACAWPVRDMIERGMVSEVEATIRRLLALSEPNENPLRRAKAWFMLWEAAYPLGVRKTSGLLGKLTSSCRNTTGWKGQDLLRDATLMVAADDPEMAQRIVAAMREGSAQRQAERRIAEGRLLSRRAFFR